MSRRITDIEGVFGAGIHAGIKSDSEKKDLGYIFVPEAVACAGVFTLNKFRAPCLDYTKESIDGGKVKAVIINSGNANAATGEQGYRDARTTAARAAELLGLQPEEVAVASTGIIGVPLPMDAISSGLSTLLGNPKLKDTDSLSDSILTTDLCRKEVFVEKEIAGVNVQVSGIAKGSGMIAPNMGTMLGFLAINIAIPQQTLQEILQEVTDQTFNMVSVDTDTSTNDMVLLFSSPSAELSLADSKTKQKVSDLIRSAAEELAKMIARDGEGASKLIEVCTEGAASIDEARAISMSIVDSPLVKTAIHGADPNWGRVIMALGKVENTHFDPKKVDLWFNEVQVLFQSEFCLSDRASLVKGLQADTVTIKLDLNSGESAATAWGCDLTKKYIDINTEYT